MFPVVVAAAMIVGVAAGWAASVALLHLSSERVHQRRPTLLSDIRRRVRSREVGALRLAMTLIGSIQGLKTEGGAVGVGRAATSAVVYSAVLILVLDACWAVTWLLGREAQQ